MEIKRYFNCHLKGNLKGRLKGEFKGKFKIHLKGKFESHHNSLSIPHQKLILLLQL